MASVRITFCSCWTLKHCFMHNHSFFNTLFNNFENTASIWNISKIMQPMKITTAHAELFVNRQETLRKIYKISPLPSEKNSFSSCPNFLKYEIGSSFSVSIINLVQVNYKDLCKYGISRRNATKV